MKSLYDFIYKKITFNIPDIKTIETNKHVTRV